MASVAPHRRAASSATVSSTGWMSAGELAMTFRTSLVAVCCASASLVSLNSRAFSIAMSAWSRNDSASAVSAAVKGLRRLPASASRPMQDSSRIRGRYSAARTPNKSLICCSCGGSSSVSQSGRCSICPDSMARDGKL